MISTLIYDQGSRIRHSPLMEIVVCLRSQYRQTVANYGTIPVLSSLTEMHSSQPSLHLHN